MKRLTFNVSALVCRFLISLFLGSSFLVPPALAAWFPYALYPNSSRYVLVKGVLAKSIIPVTEPEQVYSASTPLPEGMSIDPQTGVISGTPARDGNVLSEITVCKTPLLAQYQYCRNQTLVFLVIDPSQLPVAQNKTLYALSGVPIEFDIRGSSAVPKWWPYFERGWMRVKFLSLPKKGVIQSSVFNSNGSESVWVDMNYTRFGFGTHLRYIPNVSDGASEDSFTYQYDDNGHLSEPAQVIIHSVPSGNLSTLYRRHYGEADMVYYGYYTSVYGAFSSRAFPWPIVNFANGQPNYQMFLGKAFATLPVWGLDLYSLSPRFRDTITYQNTRIPTGRKIINQGIESLPHLKGFSSSQPPYCSEVIYLCDYSKYHTVSRTTVTSHYVLTKNELDSCKVGFTGMDGKFPWTIRTAKLSVALVGCSVPFPGSVPIFQWTPKLIKTDGTFGARATPWVNHFAPVFDMDMYYLNRTALQATTFPYRLRSQPVGFEKGALVGYFFPAKFEPSLHRKTYSGATELIRGSHQVSFDPTIFSASDTTSLSAKIAFGGICPNPKVKLLTFNGEVLRLTSDFNDFWTGNVWPPAENLAYVTFSSATEMYLSSNLQGRVFPYKPITGRLDWEIECMAEGFQSPIVP